MATPSTTEPATEMNPTCSEIQPPLATRARKRAGYADALTLAA